MVIIMKMDSGEIVDAGAVAYDDEVLNAGWAEVPRVELQLQAVMPVSSDFPSDIEGYLARLYSAQGMTGR